MKKITKIFCFLLVLSVLAPAFADCGASKAFLKYKDSKISDATYKYWLCTAKSDFIANYSDITDTVECWNRKVTGTNGESVTVGEYVEQYTLEYAKSVVCELQMFKDYNLRLTSADENEIDEYLDEIIYYRYGDSKSAFNDALKKTYGIGISDLREVLKIEKKVQVLENYLFGDSGICKPTNEEKEKFFKENYVRIYVLMIATDSEYVYNDKGEIVYNDLGLPEVRYYTEEEKEGKLLKAETVGSLIEKGEDFRQLVKEQSELHINGGENGFYFSKYDLESLLKSGYDASILSSILNQTIGETKKYVIDNEAIVYVYRAELDDAPYNTAESKEQFGDLENNIITEKYQKMLETMWADIEIDEQLYKLKTVDVNRGIL